LRRRLAGLLLSGKRLLILFDDAADAVLRAIETVLTDGPRSPDIGRAASTHEGGMAIADAVCNSDSLAQLSTTSCRDS
jgi:isocitrate/isopropylmalate dehydrogenase